MAHSDDVIPLVSRSPAGIDGLVRRAQLAQSQRRVSLGVLEVCVNIAYALKSLRRRPLVENSAKGTPACEAAAGFCCSSRFGVRWLAVVVDFIGIKVDV